MVRMLLDAGADATVINRYGVTPLHEASTVGNVGILEALLDAGADPNSGYGAGETTLMTAARTGIVATVRLLLDRGGDPNATEEWRGQTALMWAAVENHPDVAQLLIERGAMVDARSTLFDFESLEQGAGGAIVDRPTGGLTALIFAARSGAVEVGEVLAAAGADLNAVEAPVRFHGGPGRRAERSLGFRGTDDRAGRRCQRRFPVFRYRDPQYSREHQPARPSGPGRSIRQRRRDRDASRPWSGPQSGVHEGISPTPGPGRCPCPARIDAAAPGGPFRGHGFDPAAYGTRRQSESGAERWFDSIDDDGGARRAWRIRRGSPARSDPDVLECRRGCGCGPHGTGDTALHIAARRGAERIVDFLVAAGASLHRENNDGQTPSDLAFERSALLVP